MDSKKPIEIFIILVVYDLAYIMNVLLRTIKTNVSMKLRKKNMQQKLRYTVYFWKNYSHSSYETLILFANVSPMRVLRIKSIHQHTTCNSLLQELFLCCHLLWLSALSIWSINFLMMSIMFFLDT